MFFLDNRVLGKIMLKFSKVLCVIVCFLVGLYFFLSAAELQLNGYIIMANTTAVEADGDKVAVEHISEDGTLYLSDTTKVEDEEIDKYIRVATGTGTYYIPDGQMVAEITHSDAIELGKRFMILDAAVLVMLVALLINLRGRKRRSIALCVGYAFATAITDIVMKYYCVNILQTAFPIQWVVCGRYLLFVLSVILVYRRYRGRC